MAANEQLNAANEELETANEELRATYQENIVLSAQLREKNITLKALADDLGPRVNPRWQMCSHVMRWILRLRVLCASRRPQPLCST